MRMDIPKINGKEFVLCLHRFSRLNVIITDKSTVYGTPHMDLQGPVSEETSVYSYHVGPNFHFAQNDTEITNRAKYTKTLPDGSTQNIRYGYVSKSALEVTVIIPDVSVLDIQSCHAYRDADTAGSLPEIKISSDLKNGKVAKAVVGLNILGAHVSVEGVAKVTGTLWSEQITSLKCENVTKEDIHYKETSQEDWAIS